MDTLEQSVILITGIMAAGKSTIAQQLAERLPKSVHLRGDSFRRMIVNGQAKIESPLSDEAMSQLLLRYELAAITARRYCSAGFTVVCQDVIIGSVLNDAVQMYNGQNLYVIVLCPSPEVALERDKMRHKQVYEAWTPEDLDYGLRHDTPRIGLWLDTSSLTVEETVDTILEQIDKAKVSN